MNQAKPVQMQGKALGSGILPIIITPLVGKTQAALLDEVAAIFPKKSDLLEWRIDFFADIGDAQAVIASVQATRKAASDTPVLLIRRNVSEGRNPIPIAEPEVVTMCTQAYQARCVEMIDYELSNAPSTSRRTSKDCRASGSTSPTCAMRRE